MRRQTPGELATTRNKSHSGFHPSNVSAHHRGKIESLLHQIQREHRHIQRIWGTTGGKQLQLSVHVLRVLGGRCVRFVTLGVPVADVLAQRAEGGGKKPGNFVLREWDPVGNEIQELRFHLDESVGGLNELVARFLRHSRSQGWFKICF